MAHERFMELALEEAKKGCGRVNPNPMVGAVIVKNGEIIGKGYHKKFGGPHAEREALASCSQSPEGAAMYITLEPCCHYGKTPPCTEAIIESGIADVVVGAIDPNALVAGKGVHTLTQRGIRVITGVLEDECKKLNEVFFHYITQKTPFVVMKYAMTLDGKTATSTGKSKWITGETARAHVHLLRHQYTGIMVGVGTVVADNPQLTCRLPDGRNPVRIICDTNLRIPLESEIIRTAHDVKTYIATACDDCKKADALRCRGAEVIPVPKKNGRVDLRELSVCLGRLQIDSILLEGGSTLHASALEAGIVNKVLVYMAPKIFGGASAKTAVGGAGVDSPDDAYRFINRQITMLGDDILLEYGLK